MSLRFDILQFNKKLNYLDLVKFSFIFIIYIIFYCVNVVYEFLSV